MKRIMIERPRGEWTWLGVFVLLTVAFLIFFMRSGGDGGAGEAYEIVQFTGSPKVYSHYMNKWVDAERGMPFKLHDQIQTDDVSEVDLKIGNLVYLRLKKNSLLEVQPVSAYPNNILSKVYLHKGDTVILSKPSMREQDEQFRVVAPNLTATMQSAQAYVGHDLQNRYTWTGVLEGEAAVQSRGLFSKTTSLKALQKASILKGKRLYGPERVSLEDWKKMKEVYELTPKSTAFEAKQLNLSKEAGALFSKIFDHGSFFTPKFGFASREFKRHPETSEALLEVAYDVFPTGSFAGLYYKTRDFDLSDHKGFSFEARRTPAREWPEWVRIELKSNGQIVRSFAIKHFEDHWGKKTFEFQASKETPIHEMTFVFGNDRVGSSKKGSVQMRRFEWIPFTEEEVKQRAERRAQATPKTVVNAVKEKTVDSKKSQAMKKIPKPIRKIETETLKKAESLVASKGTDEPAPSRQTVKKVKKLTPLPVAQKPTPPKSKSTIDSKPLSVSEPPKKGAPKLISLFNIPLLEDQKDADPT